MDHNWGFTSGMIEAQDVPNRNFGEDPDSIHSGSGIDRNKIFRSTGNQPDSFAMMRCKTHCAAASGNVDDYGCERRPLIFRRNARGLHRTPAPLIVFCFVIE